MGGWVKRWMGEKLVKLHLYYSHVKKIVTSKNIVPNIKMSKTVQVSFQRTVTLFVGCMCVIIPQSHVIFATDCFRN